MGEVLTAVLVFGTATVAWIVVLRGTERVWFPRALRGADRVLLRVGLRAGLRTAAPEPACRPLEVVAADVRRLALRYRCPQDGARFAKVEGYRRAYDAVLVEACALLGVTNLVAVLPPGDELDRERARVEAALDTVGLSVEVWR